MLFFMPCMFVAYWVASLERYSSRSLCGSLCGSFALLAFALWCVLELLPRSFDSRVVQGRRLQAFASADAAGREALEHAYSLYRDALFGLAFVRRHALLLGQLCLAILLRRHRPWGLALAGVLGLSVVRLALGSLSSYAGWHGLSAVADPLYYVTAGLAFPLLSLWLWVRAAGMPVRPESRSG